MLVNSKVLVNARVLVSGDKLYMCELLLTYASGSGLLLRTKSVHNVNTGSHWTSSLLFSLVRELAVLWDAERDVFDGRLLLWL